MSQAIEALLRAVEAMKHRHDCCWWNGISADAPCNCELPALAAAVRASLPREPVELSDEDLLLSYHNANDGRGSPWPTPSVVGLRAVASAAQGESK